MRIRDLLNPVCIKLNGQAKDKADVIEQMVALMAKSGNISDIDVYHKGVLAREEESTTAVGEGIAIPHCKSDSVKAPCLAAMTLPAGVDYDAPDGDPVKVIFLIAAPNSKDNVHIDVLSKLSVLLLDETFAANLLKAASVEEFLSIVDAAESAKDAADRAEKKGVALPDVLAVTACPTGIAHTYMAEENLKKAAKNAGVSIKIETRGSSGTKNELTADEIAAAKAIIVAADVNVPMGRFNGRKVIQCRVSDGINKSDELVAKAKAGDAPVFTATEGESSSEKKSAGGSVYKHLMTGVSHMLPFVVGGGILIALAFLFDGIYCKMNGITPDGTFGSMLPISAFLKGKVGGVAFGFMLPVLAGFIAFSIADRPGLAVGFLGGAMAANGTSGFLGALVAGFFAGYACLLLKKAFSSMPKSLDGLKPVLIYPLIGMLIVGLGMNFIVEPVVGTINGWMNDALKYLNGTNAVVILGLIVAGMMAVDMGGPVNKAAYVFATGMLAEGHYNIMAAVMIGGMVPPIAIAAATLIFKNKFTAEERKAGPVNFVMGAAFITEGAIPYAAADPAHVLPACIVGSALAGALSMAFKCTLMAPHGGVFVFPVVGNPVMYVVALLIGSAVGCLLLGLLKKNVEE